jgi:predicted TPR repeat methyltransferase
MNSETFFLADRLLREGDARSAANAFRDIVEAVPEHVAGWRKYAEALEKLGNHDEAASATQKGNAVEADHITEVGSSLFFHGDEKRAKSFFTHALALDEDCLSAHWLLGEYYSNLDDKKTALHHYRRCMEIAPDRQGPSFMIAALGEEASPDRAPDDYVSGFFNWYAEHFDSHLTDNLKYTGPQEVARALRQARPDGLEHVIDLGCGTGLAGVALEGLAARLTGVDLSAAMLERAKATGVYQDLVEQDLVNALSVQPAESAEAAISVDVLIYLGVLAPVFVELARVLADNAIFIATFEEGVDIEDWELSSSGRYLHSENYLRKLAADSRFGVVSISRTTLREEYGVPVPSLIATFEKRR